MKRILQSLQTKYDHVVAAIEETMNLILLSVDELMRSLRLPEERLNRSKENSVESAFHTIMNLSKEKDIESKGELSSRNSAPRGCGGCSNRKRGRVEDLMEITKEIVIAKIMSQTRKIRNRKSLHPTIVKNLITLRGFVSSKKNMQILLMKMKKKKLRIFFLHAI